MEKEGCQPRPVSLMLPFHFSTMKLCTGLVFCSLVLGVSSQGWFSFMGQAYEGKVLGGGMASMATRIHPERPSGLGRLSEVVLPDVLECARCLGSSSSNRWKTTGFI